LSTDVLFIFVFIFLIKGKRGKTNTIIKKYLYIESTVTDTWTVWDWYCTRVFAKIRAAEQQHRIVDEWSKEGRENDRYSTPAPISGCICTKTSFV